MDHSTIKGYFILVILIFACIMIFCQCGCLADLIDSNYCNCNCRCICKKKNRININPSLPVEVRNNEIVVIGIPVNAFDINREGEGQIETIVVDVIN